MNTYSGVIAGNSGLIKQGEGTQVLSGDNTYSGETSFNGGILSISSDGNLGVPKEPLLDL